MLDGSYEAHKKFITLQKAGECLSFEGFSYLSQLANKIAREEKSREIFIAMLVYSDLGKTPAARARAREKGIDVVDHDDWIERVLIQDNATINYIMPSFFSFGAVEKTRLKGIASGLKVHLGHLLHLEGGVGMFNKLLPSLKAGAITMGDFELAFLIQMCDVSAAQAQVSNEGFAAMTEHTFQGYKMVWECLQKLFSSRSAEQALDCYMELRAERLGLNAKDENERVLIRLACMLRLYTSEEGKKLSAVA